MSPSALKVRAREGSALETGRVPRANANAEPTAKRHSELTASFPHRWFRRARFPSFRHAFQAASAPRYPGPLGPPPGPGMGMHATNLAYASRETSSSFARVAPVARVASFDILSSRASSTPSSSFRVRAASAPFRVGTSSRVFAAVSVSIAAMRADERLLPRVGASDMASGMQCGGATRRRGVTSRMRPRNVETDFFVQ